MALVQPRHTVFVDDRASCRVGALKVNFSEWGEYYPGTRKRKLEWIERALDEGVMPPWSYRLMHPDARLSDEDRARIVRWIEAVLTPTANGAAAK